jgi:ABC-2 type transport system ATP-binding protein
VLQPSGESSNVTVREERTHTSSALVASLMVNGTEPARLEIIRPSLEDIYLQLVADHATANEAENAR